MTVPAMNLDLPRLPQRVFLAAIGFAACSASATAQDRPAGAELRSFVGAYLPVGAQRADFSAAPSVGAQGAIEIGNRYHIVASVAWTYANHRLAAPTDDQTYIIHYDLGGEMRWVRRLSRAWLLKPYAGLGLGGRSYDFGARGSELRTHATSYAAAGVELQRGTLGARLEARSYASRFESPVTGEHHARIDALFSLGIAYHVH